MTLFFISFLAGMLTVLAPCILPLLPVVLGKSVVERRRVALCVIVASLAFSIIAFTFLLKVSTLLVSVPEVFWTSVSGGIIVFFGLTFLFPTLWSQSFFLSRVERRAHRAVQSGVSKKSYFGDMLVGVALGPLFSTCSPTYFVIVATMLPESVSLGTLYLFTYTAGLSLALLALALLGQRFSSRITLLMSGYTKLVIGVLFVLLGFMVMFGYVKKLETALIKHNPFDVTALEVFLLSQNDTALWRMDDTGALRTNASYADNEPVPTPPIQQPSGFLNTNNVPITLEEYRGTHVVLLDFMTYSCGNCRAVLPHINEWHRKYEKEGLKVIGIHTPEFAYERERDNVEKALASLGVEFPVVLDNESATWQAYGNHYWPHLYLIDKEGNIMYDHIGEGAYEEIEAQIVELLSR